MISITLISIALSHTVLTSDIIYACTPLVDKVGCYRTEEKKIYLLKRPSNWKMLMAFYHEMGHYLGCKTESCAEKFNLYAIGRIKLDEEIQGVLKSKPLK